MSINPDQITGFFNINKPAGMTSSDVVVKTRGILRKAFGSRIKTGHMGTLDPLATGVLPVAVGKATRLFDLLQSKRKIYRAVFRFGTETDTLDASGSVLRNDGRIPAPEEIAAVLPEFAGRIEQIPPQYSAKSVGGRRAYDYARAGKSVELAPRQIDVFSFELTGAEDETAFSFEIECGSGTYIRALGRDLAFRLGTIAHMTSLVRTRAGDFRLEDAIGLDDIEKSPADCLIPVSEALKNLPRFELSPEEADAVLNGRKLAPDGLPALDSFVVVLQNNIIGIGENSGGALRVKIRL